ncbi:MAG: hypothetical protein ACXVNF_09535 [Neobacillus sp.]
MSKLQRYEVFGDVSFPLRFKINAASKEEAMNYAKKVFCSLDVLKAEMDLCMNNGKKHLIICDQLTINWTESSEE